jgi:TonB-linked SusC/RagA family outer membrane protein
MKYIFYLAAFLIGIAFFSSNAQAQNRTITGVVKASDTGDPLPGVNILVEGQQRGTATDVDGKFTISVARADTLRFTSIGFKKREIVVQNQKKLAVLMHPATTELNQMVVIGYGKQSKSTLTTSISKVDTSALGNVPFSNAANALEGTVTGLRVQRATGQPGSSPTIVLRGGTSISNPNGSSPLYVIDGVRRDNMNGINPSDIKSIQVLKDAASTAIYGARASNGVIIITTKTGSPGRVQINYNSTVQMSHVAKLWNLGNARQYIYYGRLGVAATGRKHSQYLSQLDLPKGFGIGNDLTKTTQFTTQYMTPDNKFLLNQGWHSMPDPLDSSKTIIYKGTNWQHVLFRRAFSENNYISASGGSKLATFRVGVGYLHDKGIAITTGYKRLTLNASGSVKARDNITVHGQFNYSNSNTQQVGNNHTVFQRDLELAPTAKFRYLDGTLAVGQNSGLGNPLYYLNRNEAENNLARTTMRLYGTWDILPHLSFKPSLSLYTVQNLNNSFQKSFYNGSHQLIDTRNASASQSVFWKKEANGILTYQNSFFGNNNFKGELGFSYNDRKDYDLSAAGKDAATDVIPTLNASPTPVSVSSSVTHRRIISYFGRVTYNYKDTYLFSASGRYDGASNLGADHKWGFFPGISAGWNISHEKFWAPIKHVISTFKPRISYGVNGNIQGLADFQAQGAYSVGVITNGQTIVKYNGQPMVTSTTLPNQNLQWERSRSLDAGLDMGLLNDRISFNFDVYRRVTDQLLQNLSLPQYTGFISILTNLGSLENKGIEFKTTANVIQNKNGFNWSIGANASFNQNKIIKLPDNGNKNNRIGGILVYDRKSGKYVYKGGLQEGGRPGEMFAYKELGIYATNAEAAKAPLDEEVAGTDKTKFAGDVKWLDKDNNGKIDSRDEVDMGNIYPNWTGGLSTTLNYKGLQLYVRTDFELGQTIYDATLARFDGQFQGDNNISQQVVKESWLPTRRHTKIPRYYWADQLAQSNIWRGNSIFYQKGNYLAIREVTLSYNLPQKWLSLVGLDKVRIYVTGNNLKYFTAYKGLLPEQGGSDTGRYPVARSFIFGINVGL